ncbi:DUF3905 domain-containing protein [Cohnella thermotolerans]|jgi:hypothetical protein|uniref:DUF3905 domain-containing protein n=1 Tax=Cohnella thermotolerans TaxID=329858 RepID=UPI000411848B|nr:DUF3905 domain-containing protein [Cohnella thermotolerans]
MTDKKKGSAAGFVPAPGRDDPNLDPFEIEFRPEFRDNRGPREPFVNEYGVVIGDHDYESPQSPLEQWSEETDPAVMAGDQWVHPFKDIGFRTRENRDLFERGIAPSSGTFMHPALQTSRPERSAGEPPGDEDDEPYFYVPEVMDEP